MARQKAITLIVISLLVSTVLGACLPAPSRPCRVGELVPPELIEPGDGVEVTGPRSLRVGIEAYEVHFAWRYPDRRCLAGAFIIEISETEDFASRPWGFTTLDHRETDRLWPAPTGCFYWRAAAYSSVDDRLGPYSPTWNYCVREPRADATPLPGHASLAGWTYIDENVNNLRDAGEGSISGALLTLKSGACPGGADILTVESEVDGRYLLPNLSPGSFCLATSPIQQTLDPVSRSLTLIAGEMLEEVNFRYLLEPLSGTASPAPAAFLVGIDAVCRRGPHTEMYRIIDFVKAGTQLPVHGRNQDGSWFVVRLPDGRSCWISDAVGDLLGDPGRIGVITPEPPEITFPTDTPPPQRVDCAQYTNEKTCWDHKADCEWNPNLNKCVNNR